MFLIEFLDRLNGERTLRILKSHEDHKERYVLHTNTGGIIRLYCSEKTYEVQTTGIVIRKKKHKVYTVYGTCEGDIPEKLVKMISTGISINSIIPKILPREIHKKSIIHAYVSMLVNELSVEV